MLIAVPAAVIASVPARASVIQVTTTDDEAGTGPACSLREAIRSANADAAIGGCSAGSASATDVIVLPAGIYELAPGGTGEDAAVDGDLDVTGSVTILGDGADVTIVDGNGNIGGERVFQVFAPAVLTISDLTVDNGHAESGGGISNNSGTVDLRHSRVGGNVVTSLGGGILNSSGTVRLVDSTVEGNRAEFGEGGGIANLGGSTLSLTDSAVRANIADEGLGGGIDNAGSTLTITNSTVSGNDALGDLGGGIFNGQNTHVTIVGSSIVGNRERERRRHPAQRWNPDDDEQHRERELDRQQRRRDRARSDDHDHRRHDQREPRGRRRGRHPGPWRPSRRHREHDDHRQPGGLGRQRHRGRRRPRARRGERHAREHAAGAERGRGRRGA